MTFNYGGQFPLQRKAPAGNGVRGISESSLAVVRGAPSQQRGGFLGEAAQLAHPALRQRLAAVVCRLESCLRLRHDVERRSRLATAQDRKSTRLNSSHVKISYAVF